MATSAYFGVWCRACEGPIPLVEIIFGPQTYQWVLPRVAPFRVQCNSCDQSSTYTWREIAVLLSEASVQYVEHPSFRDV